MPENTTTHIQTNPLQGLGEDIRGMLPEWNVPGMALAVVKDDEIAFGQGFGVKKVGEDASIDAQTIFGVASVTKAFTAACVALLVDEGKVGWDDPVIQHLPTFQLYDPYVTREITIRDLLCARSGLVGGDLMRNGPYDRDEVVRRLRYLKPGMGFRTGMGSYTYMFLVAGQLVAAVSGQSWDDFVRERIFTPLGMNRSRTGLSDTLQSENLATPHVGLEGMPQPTFWASFDNTGPGGSISSSVMEMAQWLRLQLNEGRYNDRQVLTPAVVREMHTPHVVDHSALAKSLNPEAHIVTYGLGWHISEYRGRKMVEHGGSGYGMSARIAMLPEEHLGMILLVNTTYNSHFLEALKFRVFNAYLGIQKPDWNTRALEAYRQEQARVREARASARSKLEAQRVAGTQPSFAPEQYTGTYEDDFYGKVSIRLEDGHLVFDYGSTLVGDLAHWHYDTFIACWRSPFYGEDLVTFRLNAAGKIDEMKVTDVGTFKKGK